MMRILCALVLFFCIARSAYAGLNQNRSKATIRQPTRNVSIASANIENSAFILRRVVVCQGNNAFVFMFEPE